MLATTFTPKAILFDFDGTLSVLTLDFAQMRKSAKQGLENLLRPELMAGYDENKPVMEALAAILPQLTKETALAARELVEQNLVEFEIAAARKSRLFPFVRPILARLRRKRIKTAVITRNCRAAITVVFPDYAEYCAILLTRNDVARVKPHPGHLLSAFPAMGVKPEEALMVGDHPMDITAGKNAGCKSAALLCGEGKLEELLQAGPDYLARDARELMRQLGL
ncbi:MAG: HAD family hydrolase [Deltaproteobacteria bacterium]|jgi:phosphoglycolate phosphatase|nr:HAD family hydrolase [Deltaproteobacteria bacterium]